MVGIVIIIAIRCLFLDVLAKSGIEKRKTPLCSAIWLSVAEGGFMTHNEKTWVWLCRLCEDCLCPVCLCCGSVQPVAVLYLLPVWVSLLCIPAMTVHIRC